MAWSAAAIVGTRAAQRRVRLVRERVVRRRLKREAQRARAAKAKRPREDV